jgi:hypothetical protein
MTLFGQTGMDAVDSSCCCFPTLGVMGLVIALSITAVVRCSGGYVALAFWICALLGLWVLRPVFYPVDRDGFSDSLLWMWGASFCAPVLATIVLLRRGNLPGDASQAGK